MYIPPQHYHPLIFYNVPADRGWIRLHDARDTKVLEFGLDFLKGNSCLQKLNNNFSVRVVNAVAGHQARKFIEILFRHDVDKCDFAKRLLESTTCLVNEKFVKLSTKTILPKTYWEMLNTFEANQFNDAKSAKNARSENNARSMAVAFSSTFPFSLGSSRQPTSFAEQKRRELEDIRAKELSLFEQFDARELESLFCSIMQIFIEYNHIIFSISDSFPSSDDHFNNLDDSNCFRGRLAEAPIVKELQLFHAKMTATKLELSKLQAVFFPNVLIQLITDYFPPPSPPHLETNPEESRAWLPPQQFNQSSQLSLWS